MLNTHGRWFEPGLGPTKCRTWSGIFLGVPKFKYVWRMPDIPNILGGKQ